MQEFHSAAVQPNDALGTEQINLACNAIHTADSCSYYVCIWCGAVSVYQKHICMKLPKLIVFTSVHTQNPVGRDSDPAYACCPSAQVTNLP